MLIGLIVGFIIFGVYFGDKLLFLFEMINLVLVMVGIDLFIYIKYMLYLIILLLLICLVIYGVIGMKYLG